MFVPFMFFRAEHGLPQALHAISSAWSLSSGHTALQCVDLPAALEYPPCARARRLVRQAQVSAW
jgi:hypothetical protein